jgi:hypothetical protein
MQLSVPALRQGQHAQGPGKDIQLVLAKGMGKQCQGCCLGEGPCSVKTGGKKVPAVGTQQFSAVPVGDKNRKMDVVRDFS